MISVLLSLLQAVILLALAPAAMGGLRVVCARCQGRQGPRLGDSYRDLLTLFSRESMVPHATSWVGNVAPPLFFAAVVLSLLLFPLLTTSGMFSLWSTPFIVTGLFTLNAAILVVVGLESGGPWSGCGAARMMTATALSAPVMLLSLNAFRIATGATTVAGAFARAEIATQPYLVISAGALAMVTILLPWHAHDVARPFAGITEGFAGATCQLAGNRWGMVLWATWAQWLAGGLLVANALIPWPLLAIAPEGMVTTVLFLAHAQGVGAVVLMVVGTLMKMIAMVVVVGLWQSFAATLRYYRMQEFIGLALFLALVGLALVTVATRL